VAQLVFGLKPESSLEQKVIQSLDPWTRLRSAKTFTATQNALIARPSFARIIFDLGQGLLGALLLLVGIALILTLWLLVTLVLKKKRVAGWTLWLKTTNFIAPGTVIGFLSRQSNWQSAMERGHVWILPKRIS
jgi:hypothetical protein